MHIVVGIIENPGELAEVLNLVVEGNLGGTLYNVLTLDSY